MPGWIGYSTRTEEAAFACARCRFSGRARVTRTGIGRATLLFDQPDKALTDARQDAHDRAQRDIQRVRCPKCGERNPGQALRFWLPYVVGTAAGLSLGFYYLPPLFWALVVFGIPLYGWRSWIKLDRGVEWL